MDNNEKKDSDFGLPDIHLKPIDQSKIKLEAPKKQHPRRGNRTVIIIILFSIALTISVTFYFFKVKNTYSAKKKIEEKNKLPHDNIQLLTAAPPDTAHKPKKMIEDTLRQKIKKDTLVTGSLMNIMDKTGRYYVIVKGFSKKRNLEEYCNKLVAEGVNVKVINPRPGQHLYKLSIADFGSNKEALNHLKTLKTQFGNELWILKY